MRVQRQSEGVKKGNGQTHDDAVNNVQEYLVNNDMFGIPEWYYKFDRAFNKRNKLRDDYGHSYDIAVFQNTMFNNYPVEHLIGIIEVDGEKHSKVNQKINDGIAEKYAQEQNVPLIRLNKTECLGTKEDREQYFREKIVF